ncbi:hypothetical protein BKA67DRAFT_517703 [Truncatella angustata]|uniref:Uncharacterized protein n=1 Tax=Truncatella angustata TaxID=152316 RepID=A0A9P8UMJ1_9PEZI|nr:uncharacterized protein BKA67DRAFT_517703 [Truncatella angustata]KAH6654896.1 hypothetical protein BKA67DRAFT_517703 [Truncatella angustata]
MEFAQQQHQQIQKPEYLSGPSHWSRGPSPLRHLVGTPQSPTEASEGTIRGGEITPRRRDSIVADPSTLISHVCLWGVNGPCESGGFATKEELNWHVKAEHLLVCPVLGCTESSFEDASLVDVHLRWSHKSSVLKIDQQVRRSSDLLNTSAMKRSSSSDQPNYPASTKIPCLPQLRKEEMRLRMDMTIATSKKKCREQLRSVIDKKSKRQAAVTPRSIESPSMMMRSWTPKVIESVSFPVVWEHGVLPFLVELMPKWCGPGHVISVIRGKKRDARRICIMTATPMSKARKIMIAGHVRDLLPDAYRGNINFVFSVGDVERLTWARGLSKDMPDDICIPRNPFCYVSPQMGDSIGMVLPDGDTTATLGPCLKIGDAAFWLANFHPFVEADLNGDPVNVEHPSPEDRDRCSSENHDALDSAEIDVRLGTLTATSGYDLKTTRITHDPYWEDCEKEPPLVVTDWSLISSKSRQANMLRKFPSTATPQRDVPITKSSSVVPGVEVCSTGRTSGFKHGQVCEIPAYLDGRKNGTGKATREWFIEEQFENESEESWIRGGMGVPGDSGAAVVDCETNALIGQLWGRNKYFGPGPRLTFFTPVFDIFDDIQERCGEQTRPQLPQYREEADRWPAYPICRPCFDLQEYMASRRSSRESLISMIPGAGILADKENDLNSVSELATPRECGDQAYWIRHAGTEDAGSFFGSVVSPTPVMSTFFYNPHVASPRPHVLEMKSPYALDLHDDDLHDAGIDSSYSGLGKRQIGSVALMRSGSQQSGKKRRIM